MSNGVVDQVKSRLDIADVVGERVTLKKAGKTMKGLCPFHVEKTPSFIVFPETGTWKCFGCGAGGDVFTFVMQSQNVEFGEALTRLAARAGIELQREPRDERLASETERLYAANEAAGLYFRTILGSPAGSSARDYLRKRQISQESIEAFGLGFASEAGSGLSHHLLQQGFARETLLQAGLVGENESGGTYDRFRGRVIFPIRDSGGKLVGFGGRALSPDIPAKYLNSPQSPLFDKGACLYAIEKARGEIRSTGQVVIVEGYIDALMAHQHGFRNVVASLGTAVTDRQVSLLKRWASELCFALDPDLAGQEATARGLAVAIGALDRAATPVPTWKGFVEYVYKLKTTIKILALPPGKDPDEVIRAAPEEWRRLVQGAIPVQDFFLERVRRKHDLTTAHGKSAAVEEAMAVLSEIPDPVEQAHYIQRLAAMVGMEESFLLPRGRGRSPQRTSRRAIVSAPPAGRQTMDAETYCVALLVKDPTLLEDEPRLREVDFKDPVHREIVRRLLQYGSVGPQGTEAPEAFEDREGGTGGPLSETLSRLRDLEARDPALFDPPLDKAYGASAITLLLDNLALKRQELAAMRTDADDSDSVESTNLIRMENEIAKESHRLKLLSGKPPLPLRAIHKEVRHGE